jgi:hypothetical protein
MLGSGEGPAAGDRSSPAISRRRLLTIVAAGVAGGAAVGGIVGALVGAKPDDAAGWQLEPVPASSLPELETTLAPQQAAQLIEEARRCREPLARVAIWHSAGTLGGTVSIVSRGYRSPHFMLTTSPSLVAFPYPAAYHSGRGVLTLVGEAGDVIIALRPQYINRELKGTVPINVWWTPVEGCP